MLLATVTLTLILGPFLVRGDSFPLVSYPILKSDCRTFVVCLCGMDDAEDHCECPGEVRFGKEVEEGGTIILFPLFVDPLTKSNWRVKLTLSDTAGPSAGHKLGFNLGLEGQEGVGLDGEAHIEVTDKFAFGGSSLLPLPTLHLLGFRLQSSTSTKFILTNANSTLCQFQFLDSSQFSCKKFNERR